MSQSALEPKLLTEIPGPGSRALAKRLAAAESQNVTCTDPEPIFWQRAAGSNVWDVDGNRFVDLTAAFGVANVGHAHPKVVSAIAQQAASLLHGMGDVHPPAIKVELLEALVNRYPGGAAARGILSSSGSDAVESAIKTALLATHRPGILAFEGAYHGLALGALDTTWRADFRDPFASRLPQRTVFAAFDDLDAARSAIRSAAFPIGAILVEPIQGRGGERVPRAGYLAGLAELCRDEGMLLIADEIYTGFGRTGRWFACDHENVVPDLLCVGKGMASGMPISACLGPASCAAALASIEVLETEGYVEHAARLGARALEHLSARSADRPEIIDVRGRGLMLGIELSEPPAAGVCCQRALAKGVIALPSGSRGEVISVTPPLCIDESALLAALDVLLESLS
ncbi:MAG: aspartate aminotransferase family protein [Deltaproteobacteria bacterium]|nr:aspartate aminotransferase family protein [Deltaproteobacteria bacterium]